MKKISKIALGAIAISVAVLSGCIITFDTVDYTAPYLTVTTPADYSHVDLPFTLSGTVLEEDSDLVGVYLSTNGGTSYFIIPGTANLSYSSSAQPWSFSVTAVSTNFLKLYAVDSEDNTSSYTYVNFYIGFDEIEPNDSFSTANSISVDGYLDGYVSSGTDYDYYKVYLNSGSTYDFSTTTNAYSYALTDGVDTEIIIYDTSQIFDVTDDDSGDPAGYSYYNDYYANTSGYYYIVIRSTGSGDALSGYYRLMIDLQ